MAVVTKIYTVDLTEKLIRGIVWTSL